jgi:serine/threonine protein kinase
MSPEADFKGFRIDEVLSRSSTTNVYRAFQHSLQRTVLIKELRPELFREEDLRRRFEREAQGCARIRHENIVVIYHYSAESDRIYLVMEFVDGYSLADFIQENPRPPLNFIHAIIIQTLRGLGFAHSQGVVHRDLKPENILISRDGWVKISDFGLAQFEGTPQVTRAGAIVGTPAYLSPEAISGGAVTAQSDIFSLGVTFYQVLTGEKVFYAEHFSDSLKNVLSHHPNKPSQLRPEVSPAMDRLIMRMLEKQPSKRWRSCEEIMIEVEKLPVSSKLDDLKRVVREVLAAPSGELVEFGQTVPEVPPSKTRSKKSLLLWAVLLVVVVAVLLYGASFFGKSERIPDSERREDRDSATTVTSLLDQEALESTTTGDTVQAEQSSFIQRQDSSGVVQPEEVPVRSESVQKEVLRKVPETVMTETAIEPGAEDSVKDSAESELLTDLSLPAIPARLHIRCDPWADVYIDDILVGKTPFDFVQVEPGSHRLIFRHPEFAPIFRDVDVESGGEMNIKVNFWDTVGRIVVLVTPWAEVYVNGNYIDVTPLNEAIIVPLGTSTITLRNPAAAPWEEKLRFDRGDPPCTLKVNLQPAEG